MFTNLEESMQIITYSGEARSDYMEAIKLASKGNISESESLFDSAKEKILNAHKIQTKLIQKECQDERTDIHLLLVHAQDHLMSTLVIRDLSKYIIDIYQKLERKE